MKNLNVFRYIILNMIIINHLIARNNKYGSYLATLTESSKVNSGDAIVKYDENHFFIGLCSLQILNTFGDTRVAKNIIFVQRDDFCNRFVTFLGQRR